jgi:hypothetical protein
MIYCVAGSGREFKYVCDFEYQVPYKDTSKVLYVNGVESLRGRRFNKDEDELDFVGSYLLRKDFDELLSYIQHWRNRE